MRHACRPREHERCPLTDACAPCAHLAALELHQAPDDVEAEAGAEVAAAATRMQAAEFLEEPWAIGRPEADAAVADGELDLTAEPPTDESDAAAADRGDRRERVLEEIAQDDIERQRVGHYFEAALDLGADGDPILRGALLEARDHSRHCAAEIHRLAPEVDAAAIEPHALEDLHHHAFHACEVGEHPLDQGA